MHGTLSVPWHASHPPYPAPPHAPQHRLRVASWHHGHLVPGATSGASSPESGHGTRPSRHARHGYVVVLRPAHALQIAFSVPLHAAHRTLPLLQILHFTSS